jgi:hypothetical protein
LNIGVKGNRTLNNNWQVIIGNHSSLTPYKEKILNDLITDKILLEKGENLFQIMKMKSLKIHEIIPK